LAGAHAPTLRRCFWIWILATPGIDGRQDEAVGVLVGNLVRFLLSLVEANQTRSLPWKTTTDHRCLRQLSTIARNGSWNGEATNDVTTNRDRVTATTRTGIVAWAISQAIQIIVTVLAAISAAVFVVAIGVFVARTLHRFGRVPRSPDHQPGPHETAMHPIHERISLEEGNAIVAELNPVIDFERYGGKPVPRWARLRIANTPVPEDDSP
jgi:hypothetical protein